MMLIARMLSPTALLGLGFFVGFYLGYRTGHEQARYERNREMARGHDWRSRAEPEMEDAKFSVHSDKKH